MKNTLLKITGFFALAVLLVSFTNSPKINSLKIGKKAPMTNYEMKNVSGEDYSLEKLAFENGILVIFSCNSCPFVVGNKEMEGWQGRYNEIHDLCKRNKIGMALVNSNESKRTGADSFTEISDPEIEKTIPSSSASDAVTAPIAVWFSAALKVDDEVKLGILSFTLIKLIMISLETVSVPSVKVNVIEYKSLVS